MDCGSAGGQIDENIFLGVFNAVTNQPVLTHTIPVSNTRFIQKKQFECIDNPPVICYRIDSYSTTIDLPDNKDGLILSVQRCCRISDINNVSNSSNTGVAYSVKLFPSLNGDGLLINSSPVFSREDTALVCANYGFNFPFKAFDNDGDSLVYQFTPGLNSPTREAKPFPPFPPPFPDLTYAGVYTANQPMGSKVSIDPITGMISGIAPGQAGDYVMAVQVAEYRGGVKIATTRKELHLSVGNCSVPKAILPANIINCNNFSVSFENQSFSSGINSYFWEFGVQGSHVNTSEEAKPVFEYPDTGYYTAKLLVNRNGICPDSTQTTVKIFPGFRVDFSNLGFCRQAPYVFKDASITQYGIINKWHWDFGDPTRNNDTSNIQNPTYKYEADGNYLVKLVTESSKGCIDSTIQQLKVNDKPVLQLGFRDTLICSGDTLQLYASLPGNYSWSPAFNMINPTSDAPLVFPQDTTTYYVTLNNNNCIGNDSVTINVVDFITVEAGKDTVICLGDAIKLNAAGYASTYVWSPAINFNNPAIKNPIATIFEDEVKLTLFASLGNCTHTDSLTIITHPYPVIFAGNDTAVCQGSPVYLHGSTNASRFRWVPENGVENSSSLETRAFPPVSTPYILTGHHNSGCNKPVSDTVLVTVIPRITVFAGNDTFLVMDQPLQLNGVAGGTNYEWSPVTGISNPNILDPILLLPQELARDAGEYLRYTLTSSVAAGCSASDDIDIRLFHTKPAIFVPSGFTPNGDGLNDVIRPILAGILNLRYFRIYNRYGNLIYETKTPGAGWDGTIKGQPQPPGTYVYDCRATDFKGDQIKVKNSFVLIR